MEKSCTAFPFTGKGMKKPSLHRDHECSERGAESKVLTGCSLKLFFAYTFAGVAQKKGYPVPETNNKLTK